MENYIFHNSQEHSYRRPFGAVPCGSDIELRIELGTSEPVYSVELILVNDENDRVESTAMQPVEHRKEWIVYGIYVNVPETPGLLWYYFKLRIGSNTFYYGNNSAGLGGIGDIYHSIPPSYQVTVYSAEVSVPAWYRRSIMYQIFVDRFCNGNGDGRVLSPKKNSFIYGNWEDKPAYIKDCETGDILRWDFFGGNLLGVLEKLEYLQQLGISVIYFNPIFEASSNHKYDTGDYKKIDSMFGDNELFRELCAKAKERGISIILDGVFSHTGSDSIYFNRYGSYDSLGAFQSSESPYFSWYRFGQGCNSYECWWGVQTLPNVDELNPDYMDFIIRKEDSVLCHWMKLGAKGWRLDVADELPDEFIKAFKSRLVETDREAVLIGEVWEDASNKSSYGKRRKYLMGHELDSIMNYPFRSIMIDFLLGVYDSEYTTRGLMSIYENYPIHNFYANMNLIGGHDVPRILTILGEAPLESSMPQRQKESYKLSPEQRKLGIDRLKLLSVIQLTFPGVPCIYYGDEVGVEGYRDPLNRSTYPWGSEDTALLEWYRRLTTMRKAYEVFAFGQFIPLRLDNDIFGYVRRIAEGTDVFGLSAEDNTAVILINRSSRAIDVTLDMRQWSINRLYDILDEEKGILLQEGLLNMNLKPLEGKILIEKLKINH